MDRTNSPAVTSGDRLDSWKDIAAYLGRNERTVRRWEAREGLPVHRLVHEKRGSIYAYRSELDAWLSSRKQESGGGEESRPLDARSPDAAIMPDPKSGFPKRLILASAGVLAVSILVAAAVNALGLRAWLSSDGLNSRGGTAPPTMVAVLPIENLTGDPNREYVSDGLTEELITELGRINPQELGVIARTSAMSYKKTIKRADEIARELRADYLVEGSIRWAGDRVRISVQLIRAQNQTHLWAQSYDRDIRDVIALEAEIASQVAREIQIRLMPRRNGAPLPPHAIDPAAHLAYLEGRYYWSKRSQAALEESIAKLKEAVQIDPDYAQAHAALAESYNSLAVIGDVDPRQIFPRAREAALEALRLNDGISEAHAAMAYLKMYADWDWAAAEREFRRAIELDPGNATVHQWYAEYLRLMDRQQEAIRESDRALELDPVSLIVNTEAGLAYYFLGRFDRACAHYRKTLELDPSFPLAHFHLAWAYEEEAQYHQSIAEFQKVAQLDQTAVGIAALAHVYGMAGEKRKATQVLEKLLALSRIKFVSPSYVAVVYEGMGEEERAMDWLEKAYGQRFWGLAWLKVERKWVQAHRNPRFIRILQGMNFPST